MGHPIAVAFVHGIGRTEPGYSAPLAKMLAARFTDRVGRETTDPASQVVFEEVNWSVALQAAEDRLWERMKPGADLRFERLRHFMLDFAADAIAYQPTHSDRSAYDTIHAEVAATMARLTDRAGARAPLIVVAHSLGTVIASNYFYDLWKPRGSFLAPEVRARIGRTPLERGGTLARFYTMGSPIALWSLRYPGYGTPIRMPARTLARNHPGLRPEWINLYDADDVIGYPLKPLNALYAAAVSEDLPVSVGTWLTGWNPLAHTGYWGSRGVADLIADSLADVWRGSRAIALVSAGRRPSRRTSRTSSGNR